MAKYDPKSIPKSLVVPRAVALAEIDEVEDTDYDGRLVERARFTILAPKILKGRKITESWFIGTDDDPEASDPQTWEASMGAIRYNQMLRAAGVTVKGNTKLDNEAAQGKKVGLVINVVPDKEGVDRNRIPDYFPEGEREYEMLSDTDTPTSSGGRKPKPKPAARKKRADPDEDDDGEEEDESDDDEKEEEDEEEADDEDEEEEKPKKRTKPAAKPAPRGKSKKGTTGKKEELKTCPTCNEKFPRSEIMEHMEGCDEDEE